MKDEKKIMRKCLFFTCWVLTLLLTAASATAQRELGARPTDSGGPLMPEQAAYDVKAYDLALKINPAEQSIKGTLTVQAQIISPTAWFVLDLDDPLKVESVYTPTGGGKTEPLEFERRGGKIWIAFPLTKQPGEMVKVSVDYGGKPRVAPRPPWVGGFIWAKTASGQPWIATACQMDGADIWWPCKDHPSDEADSFALHITVPEPLIVATNGRLQNVKKNGDGTQTFNWLISVPFNNYSVALNIAPYRTIEGKFKSITGETVPITFWVLPEHYEKGQQLFPQITKNLNFFEKYLGPYPFRAEKIGVAETPHLGMEHSTVTAYGANFKDNAAGFDSLLFHEMGHDWWANLVTASDWRDFWLHEGFESFMDALYAGELKGEAAYEQAMAGARRGIRNKQAVAPREARSAMQIYMTAPDYLNSDGDIYGKGALILHTLRYLIGDEAFFKSLRRMAYPDPKMELVKDGRQFRFATTDDFRHIAEQISGKKLDWFFDVYLRQPALPRLVVSEAKGNALALHWDAPDGIKFPMPVEVEVGGKTRRVEMNQDEVTVSYEPGQKPVVDPKNKILKQ
jgi:aminopeptidase N